MNPLAATRRVVPGIALVLAGALLAGALGLGLSMRSWMLLVALGMAVGALAQAGRSFWIGRTVPPLEPDAPPVEVPHGRKGMPTPQPYDLAQDQSTDNQRYLM